MGRTLLILLAGFAAAFGVLATSKNQHFANSVDQMVEQYAGYSSQNAAASGAYMALNQLYLNPAWRAGFSNLVIGNNTVNVAVNDDSLGAMPLAHRIKISANAGNGDAADLVQVSVFDSEFQEFAVWAKDSVINVTTQDSNGVAAPDLLIKKAPFMPKIDKAGIMSDATAQGHVYNNDNEGHYHPDNGFPNGSFFYDSTAVSQTANVIHVGGDLHVRDNRTVYGIYIVEGDVLLSPNAKIRGVLYLPNSSSRVYNRDIGNGQVTGGIVTWGRVDGKTYPLIVKHRPRYLRELVSHYASDNPPIRVLTWK
jgi:hypothetical protein